MLIRVKPTSTAEHDDTCCVRQNLRPDSTQASNADPFKGVRILDCR